MEAILRSIGQFFEPLNWDNAAVKRGVLIVAVIIEWMVITLEIFIGLGSVGKNVFWYFAGCGLVIVIVAINWIAKKGDVMTLKTVAKVGLVVALVMMPVCTVWRSNSLKAAADYADSRQTTTQIATNWWADEIPIGKDGQITIGEVKANDQLRSWSANGHIILRDGYAPNPIQGGVDMTTTFEIFEGNKTIKLSGNGKIDTIVRYKIIRR